MARANVRTLENRGQGRARPNAQAALLLRLVERFPDAAERLVKGEGDYKLADLTMSLAAGVVVTEAWEGKPEGAKLHHRLDTLLGFLEEEEAPKRPDFARATYLPFTRELRRSGQLEAFTHFLFAPAGVAGLEEWLRSHPEKTESLRKFLGQEGAL